MKEESLRVQQRALLMSIKGLHHASGHLFRLGKWINDKHWMETPDCLKYFYGHLVHKFMRDTLGLFLAVDTEAFSRIAAEFPSTVDGVDDNEARKHQHDIQSYASVIKDIQSTLKLRYFNGKLAPTCKELDEYPELIEEGSLSFSAKEALLLLSLMEKGEFEKAEMLIRGVYSVQSKKSP